MIVMKKLPKYVTLCGIAMSGGISSAHAAAIDQQQFDDWIQTRCGTGDPIYWYARGDVRAFPGDGEVLYRMDFMEENRLVADPENPANKICLGRKMSIFLDKDTGQILHEFRGHSLAPVIYPYQVIEMTLGAGRVAAVATQGSGKSLRTYKLADVVTVVSFAGRTDFVAAAMFTTPHKVGGEHISEYLTYTVAQGLAGQQRANPGLVRTVTFNAPGGDGNTYFVEHAAGARMKSYQDLPMLVREFIKTEAPIFVAPPLNMAEINRMQREY
jgi:hypothetical protein